MKKLGLVTKILLHVTLIVFGIMAVGGPILLANKGAINGYFGIQTSIGSTNGSDGSLYYDTKFENMDEVAAATKDIIEETMEEGAVLLKNDNDALPLEKNDKVNMYGIASYYTVVTGQGSGVGDAKSNVVKLYDGLTSAGLIVNSEMNEWYKSQNVNDYLEVGKRGGSFTGGGTQQSQFVVKDANWNELPDAKNNEARAGIVVFARNSGEAIDLYMDSHLIFVS